MFDGFAYPNASAAVSVPVEVTTLRKNLENFRSVLYSAAQHCSGRAVQRCSTAIVTFVTIQGVT